MPDQMTPTVMPSDRLDAVLKRLRQMRTGRPLTENQLDTTISEVHEVRMLLRDLEDRLVPRDRVCAFGRALTHAGEVRLGRQGGAS